MTTSRNMSVSGLAASANQFQLHRPSTTGASRSCRFVGARPSGRFSGNEPTRLEFSKSYRTSDTEAASTPRSGTHNLGMHGFVAQIFNLPYRRFEIGSASDQSHAPRFPSGWQTATVRNSAARRSRNQRSARLRPTGALPAAQRFEKSSAAVAIRMLRLTEPRSAKLSQAATISGDNRRVQLCATLCAKRVPGIPAASAGEYKSRSDPSKKLFWRGGDSQVQLHSPSLPSLPSVTNTEGNEEDLPTL